MFYNYILALRRSTKMLKTPALDLFFFLKILFPTAAKYAQIRFWLWIIFGTEAIASSRLAASEN